MQKKFVFFFLALTVLAFGVGIGRFILKTARNSDNRRKLVTVVVYAPTSFVDSYGPGEDLKKMFETTCDCTIVYVDVGSSRLAIDRMAFDPKKRVDVVVGLDLLLLKTAATRVKFQELNDLSAPWQDQLRGFSFRRFTPYDWSPMGFVYREPNKDLPKVASLEAALNELPEKSISLADPNSSTVGLEWLYWLFRTSTNVDESLRKLARLTYIVTPNWSASYGLFKKHQVPMTFSYLTSLLYHWQVEKDHSYQFMQFSEGHPVQVEYAAVPEACWDCAVAKNFVQFLTSVEAQKVLAQKNYMLPAVKNIPLDSSFEELPKVKTLGLEKIDEFVTQQPQLIEVWKKAN